MRPCLFAAAFLLSAAAAFADPVRIVTSGGVGQIVEDGETSFTLRGSGFVFSGEVQARLAGSCGPCIPGTTFNLSATMNPSLFPPGSATIDGRTYDSVYFTGDWDFDAGSVIVPNVPPGERGIRPETTFTFSGTLSAYADIALTGMPLFTTQLAGRGIARTGFFNYPVFGGVITQDGFGYEFVSAAPVPEPGSLFLFGSGAAWVAVRLRKRRVTAAV